MTNAPPSLARTALGRAPPSLCRGRDSQGAAGAAVKVQARARGSMARRALDEQRTAAATIQTVARSRQSALLAARATPRPPNNASVLAAHVEANEGESDGDDVVHVSNVKAAAAAPMPVAARPMPPRAPPGQSDPPSAPMPAAVRPPPPPRGSVAPPPGMPEPPRLSLQHVLPAPTLPGDEQHGGGHSDPDAAAEAEAEATAEAEMEALPTGVAPPPAGMLPHVNRQTGARMPLRYVVPPPMLDEMDDEMDDDFGDDSDGYCSDEAVPPPPRPARATEPPAGMLPHTCRMTGETAPLRWVVPAPDLDGLQENEQEEDEAAEADEAAKAEAKAAADAQATAHANAVARTKQEMEAVGKANADAKAKAAAAATAHATPATQPRPCDKYRLDMSTRKCVCGFSRAEHGGSAPKQPPRTTSLAASQRRALAKSSQAASVQPAAAQAAPSLSASSASSTSLVSVDTSKEEAAVLMLEEKLKVARAEEHLLKVKLGLVDVQTVGTIGEKGAGAAKIIMGAAGRKNKGNGTKHDSDDEDDDDSDDDDSDDDDGASRLRFSQVAKETGADMSVEAKAAQKRGPGKLSAAVRLDLEQRLRATADVIAQLDHERRRARALIRQKRKGLGGGAGVGGGGTTDAGKQAAQAEARGKAEMEAAQNKEAQAKMQARARMEAEAEAEAKREAEARKKAEAEVKAKREAEIRRKAEADAIQAGAREAEAKAAADAQATAHANAVARTKQEMEAVGKANADAKAKAAAAATAHATPATQPRPCDKYRLDMSTRKCVCGFSRAEHGGSAPKQPPRTTSLAASQRRALAKSSQAASVQPAAVQDVSEEAKQAHARAKAVKMQARKKSMQAGDVLTDLTSAKAGPRKTRACTDAARERSRMTSSAARGARQAPSIGGGLLLDEIACGLPGDESPRAAFASNRLSCGGSCDAGWKETSANMCGTARAASRAAHNMAALRRAGHVVGAVAVSFAHAHASAPTPRPRTSFVSPITNKVGPIAPPPQTATINEGVSNDGDGPCSKYRLDMQTRRCVCGFAKSEHGRGSATGHLSVQQQLRCSSSVPPAKGGRDVQVARKPSAGTVAMSRPNNGVPSLMPSRSEACDKYQLDMTTRRCVCGFRRVDHK